ncbi:MAG: ArsI/CadI family heavy metal resistance metalloenzyme [Ilumatobacteraceae bacterium]
MTSRVQLALNVSNLAEAVEFYSKMFSTKPAKLREGYANFAIAEPPLKLVLIETPKTDGGEYTRINHLGVEVMSTEEVDAAITRFQDLGWVDAVEKDTTCCFAVQDKVWVHDPDGAPWEYYTVLADANAMNAPIESTSIAGACCSTDGAISCC